MADSPKPPVNRWKARKDGGHHGLSVASRDPSAAIEKLTRTGKQTAEALRRDDIGALLGIESRKGK